MSRRLIAATVSLTLCILLSWLWQREQRIGACQASGGLWNGAQSRCEKPPHGPILQRDLRRT